MKISVILAVTAALACGSVAGYTIDQGQWFAYFQGQKVGQPQLVLLGRAKCSAKGGRAEDKWFVAREVVFFPSSLGGVPGEVAELPACWRQEPGGGPNKQYCRVVKQTNELGDVCLWIGNSRFLDTRSLPAPAPID